MLELNKKVFGNIITQEIIGSEPSIAEIKIIFEKELLILVEKLDGGCVKSSDDPKK